MNKSLLKEDITITEITKVNKKIIENEIIITSQKTIKSVAVKSYNKTENGENTVIDITEKTTKTLSPNVSYESLEYFEEKIIDITEDIDYLIKNAEHINEEEESENDEIIRNEEDLKKLTMNETLKKLKKYDYVSSEETTDSETASEETLENRKNDISMRRRRKT